MQPSSFYVMRNGVLQIVPSNQLQVTDRILTTAGEYVPVATLLETRQAQQWPATGLSALVDVVGMIGLLVGTAWILGECFKTTPSRAQARRRNTQSVEAWKRDYVSHRDGWRCTYCGQRVSRRSRHIDHSMSRRNGGTNHLNNLRTACQLCNLSKGVLNARQFLAGAGN
jgi:hypothetical protein